MESKLGYLLSSPVPSQTIDNTFQMFNTLVQPLEESNIAKFWSLGTLSATDSSSDNQFLTSYLKSSVTCQPDGSYVVKFPWKDSTPLFLRTDTYVRKEQDPWHTSSVTLPTYFSCMEKLYQSN